MPNKYNKKLVRIGQNLGIIIPVAWTRYYNLKYGDKVEVITNGNVVIKPYKEGEIE